MTLKIQVKHFNLLKRPFLEEKTNHSLLVSVDQKRHFVQGNQMQRNKLLNTNYIYLFIYFMGLITLDTRAWGMRIFIDCLVRLTEKK